MPSWGEVLHELNETVPFEGGEPDYDGVRRRYLAELHRLTGRPAILYYSNWLDEARGGTRQSISLDDVQGFMTTVRGLEGEDLDLLLHLPGGDPHAAERIVDYLRSKFSGEIRAFVPVAAMSAGTMLALGCDRIVMGAHSQLGPIDPQLYQRSGGIIRLVPARAIMLQFAKARRDIMQHQEASRAWHPILEQYGTALLEECEAYEKLAKTLVRQWLERWMLDGDADLAEEASGWFADFDTHLSHRRGISRGAARRKGIVIDDLEASQDLQDAVLSVHHATTHAFSALPVTKIIENHLGSAFIRLES